MRIHLLSFEQYYLPGKPVLPLAVAGEYAAEGVLLRACVSDRVDALQQFAADGLSLDAVAAALTVAVLDFSLPWRLQPVAIAKPWGQEIWYTGIEARGVSGVVSDTGTTPLDWAIAVARQRVLGEYHSPNLLKILDPLPDDVFGDLYFELHEQKREVYVVTHVDEQAWPDGVGAIRFGFSAAQRAQYADDEVFLSAYHQSVRAYQMIRRDLDGRVDVLRQRDGVGLNDPVSAEQTRHWLAELPAALCQQERVLREQMDAFTHLRSLRVGDVLAVPLRTPHALQHGVRTVEFQTPVYERKILSFAQKVLTQNHWDTEQALRVARLDVGHDQDFPELLRADGVRIEEIVRFDDFSVQRIYLLPGAGFSCELAAHYCVLMVVCGEADIAGMHLLPEQAVLLPASVNALGLRNTGCGELVVLLAQPA